MGHSFGKTFAEFTKIEVLRLLKKLYAKLMTAVIELCIRRVWGGPLRRHLGRGVPLLLFAEGANWHVKVSLLQRDKGTLPLTALE